MSAHELSAAVHHHARIAGAGGADCRPARAHPGATVEVPWIPALQKDTRTRNTHSSTAIEGNPLTLEQVRAVEEGREIPAVAARAKREVVNYFAALRFVEKNAAKKTISHEEILRLHKIMAGDVMDQGTAGRYRTIAVRVGRYVPPPPEDVSGLMFELLTWWNKEAAKMSPVLSSAIVHYRFESIHPFADGNGRTGRALALWELYRRGFDTHHIFSVDEFYWENRPRYYAALDAVRREGEDLSGWLEYAAEGLQAHPWSASGRGCRNCPPVQPGQNWYCARSRNSCCSCCATTKA